MPQKPLKKGGKAAAPPKLQAANRHGKVVKQKKGSLVRPPRSERAKALHEDAQELTKRINQSNEAAALGKATTEGRQLQVVKTADGKK